MKWHELKVATNSQASDLVSGILLDIGSTGVSIEDPNDLIFLEDDGLGQIKPSVEESYESVDTVYVSGFFPDTKNIVEIKLLLESRLEQAKAYDIDLGSTDIVLSSVSEEDWANAWKAHYHPVRLSRFLTIVPSWETYDAGPNEHVILLDPGMAFGTGTHPTTKLALEALEMTIRGGEHILDIGTGSGILSIASKVFGAGIVEAYDLDEKATLVAKENIALNGYESDIIVGENNLLVGIERQADIIVANILAEILERMVIDAYQNVKAGGYFILSGIIQSKREELAEQLISVGFDIVQENRMKDWVSLICQKPVEEGE